MGGPISTLPEYPHEADAKIREFATLPFIGRPDILHLLDDIRYRLLGNPTRIQEMALRFANNKTIQDARSDFESAAQSLAGTWSGRAADQFSAYASRVTGVLEKEQEAVGAISGLLVDVAQVIVDTYAKAIEFLGVCAGRLATIDIKMLLAAAASVVPGLNAIVWSDVIDTIVEAFVRWSRTSLLCLGLRWSKRAGFSGRPSDSSRSQRISSRYRRCLRVRG